MTLLGHSGPLARLLPLLRAVVREPSPADPPRPVHVVGHRGSPRECPENTLPSFRLALDRGADAVEADVCSTQDGVFVLWHDADPDARDARGRQAGIERLRSVPVVPAVGSPWRRPVRELTLEQMRQHHGYKFREGSARNARDGDARPEIAFATLEELFDLTRDEPRLRHVYLDVKLEEIQVQAALELGRAVRRFAEASGSGLAVFHFLSPRLEVARVFLEETSSRATPSRLQAYADFELPGAVDFARRLGARNVSMGGARLWPGLRQELGEAVAARDAGRLDRVVAWTFNNRNRLAELVRLGADAILTDDVPVLRALVSGRNRQPSARTPHPP